MLKRSESVRQRRWYGRINMQTAAERNTTRPGPEAGATQALVRFASGLRYDALPEVARHAARRHSLDTVGAILAGTRQCATKVVERTLLELAGEGRAVVPGLARRFDPLSAAYIAGTAGHGLELDDGYRPGSVHPGTVVIPALLATASTGRYDGRQWITAVVAGYEATCRVAAAIHPASRRKGFHNTPVAGVMGATLAVGSLLGLDEVRMAHALGLAASSAAGIFAFLAGGGEVKRTHPGHAAREALQCAFAAKNGLTGPAGVLEATEGFFETFSEGVDASAVTDGLFDGELVMTRCYIKPHAACRHLHPGIDAVLDILVKDKIKPDAVERIDVGSYAIAAAHGQARYGDMLSAQMSYPFALATALERRAVNLSHFDDKARANEAVLRHLPKVHVTTDADCEAAYPKRRPAKVAVHMRDGTVYRRRVDEPYGGAGNPVVDAALLAKFHGLADPVLGAARADEAELMLWNLDDVTNIANLTDRLVGLEP
jgi:2-methylcitrate dehydratase PrpD